MLANRPQSQESGPYRSCPQFSNFPQVRASHRTLASPRFARSPDLIWRQDD
jgi:hypothetical protein